MAHVKARESTERHERTGEVNARVVDEVQRFREGGTCCALALASGCMQGSRIGMFQREDDDDDSPTSTTASWSPRKSIAKDGDMAV